ncbi:MAG: hypothetical protein A2015_12545 [Spirochaetes bacterium GWF1_31_7]|nr:MAG: hypothetical protein A2Y30_12465 [Spirochaetes bacterium GWE1_32_154]OHD44818.1 MAG: hypothetical protein A2Y29_03410 [Spirochaetes bacterium GWE2_31_10]OHD49609.1 MAG: hypothetical protein A2015_12545 [Spirochaetes bacterium GWF1_31_7]OHD82758.1 MAG: hypothetical protein A2355_05290 [Spirochaetes bacterium RIFOXYB1_FULL_32_8]HBD93752.1 hypothetical protein [Spirochaetia bacterium]
MEKIAYERLIKELRTFSFSFAIGMAILSIMMLYKDYEYYLIAPPIILSSYHLLTGIFYPLFSWPFFTIMNTLFKIISFFLTIFTFSFIFYGIITPVSFILRLVKKDHIAKNSNGWIKRLRNDPKQIEKLF